MQLGILFAEWTPEQVNTLVATIGTVMTTVLSIVVAIVGYLIKQQANRVETKTDAQTETLAKQDQVLEHVSETAKQIKSDVKEVANKQ